MSAGNREGLTAEDIMQTTLKMVSPTMGLPELEQELLSEGVSGFPVVEPGRRLVGIVSRADVVRALCKERELAGRTSDFYIDATGFHEAPLESFKDIADRVGERLESLTVQDVMVTDVHRAGLRDPLVRIANLFLELNIHRLPVVDGAMLVGLITTMDLVRLISQKRVQ